MGTTAIVHVVGALIFLGYAQNYYFHLREFCQGQAFEGVCELMRFRSPQEQCPLGKSGRGRYAIDESGEVPEDSPRVYIRESEVLQGWRVSFVKLISPAPFLTVPGHALGCGGLAIELRAKATRMVLQGYPTFESPFEDTGSSSWRRNKAIHDHVTHMMKLVSTREASTWQASAGVLAQSAPSTLFHSSQSASRESLAFTSDLGGRALILAS